MQAANPSCSSEGMTVHDNMQLPFHSNGSFQSPAHFSTGRNLKKLNIYIVQRHPRHLLPEALPTWLREFRDRSHVFSASLCSRVAGCRVLRAPQYKMCVLACSRFRGLPKQIWAMSGKALLTSQCEEKACRNDGIILCTTSKAYGLQEGMSCIVFNMQPASSHQLSLLFLSRVPLLHIPHGLCHRPLFVIS